MKAAEGFLCPSPSLPLPIIGGPPGALPTPPLSWQRLWETGSGSWWCQKNTQSQEAHTRVQKACCQNKIRNPHFRGNGGVRIGALSRAQSSRATEYLPMVTGWITFLLVWRASWEGRARKKKQVDGHEPGAWRWCHTGRRTSEKEG